jgi:sn-glycerol 3-phosphate transport system substrate-binding protein
MIDGKVYGIPYQNSAPLMYYNVAAFTDAGLDPDEPPTTWREWLDAAKKLTKPGGKRWGINFPGTYDYCG